MTVAIAQNAKTTAINTLSVPVELTGVSEENILLLFISGGDSAVQSVGDDAATPYTWTKQEAVTVGIGGGGYDDLTTADIWTGVGGSGGSVTATATLSGYATDDVIYGNLLEIEGANSSSPLASVVAISNNSEVTAEVISPTVHPETTGDLIVILATAANDITGSPGSPWNIIDTDPQSQIAYQTGTSGTPLSAEWSLNEPSAWVVIAVEIEAGVPYSPILTSPANGSYSGLAASGGPFAWDYEGSGSQTAYHFRRKVSGASGYQYWDAATGTFTGTDVANTSASTSVTFPAGTFTNGDTYNWSVASVNAAGEGPYAPDLTVVAQAAPTVTTTAPTGTVATATPTVEWSTSVASGATQSMWRVVTYSQAQWTAAGFVPGSGPSLDDSGTHSGTATIYTIATPLPNDHPYRSYVFITQTPGSQVGSTYAGYAVYLVPPGGVSLTGAATRDANGVPCVVLTASGVEDGLQVEFQASYDNGVTWGDIRLNWVPLVGGTATTFDYEGPFNVEALYYARVTQTEDGATLVSAWSDTVALTVSSPQWWIVEPLNPAQAVPLSRISSTTTSSSTGLSTAVVPPGLTSSIEIDETEQQGAFYAFGRTTAIVVHGDLLNPEFDLTLIFLNEADFQTFRSIRRDQVVVLVKSDLGDLYYCSFGPGFPAITIRSGDRLTNPKKSVNVHCFSADQPAIATVSPDPT